jgi:hypothetical protein
LNLEGLLYGYTHEFGSIVLETIVERRVERTEESSHKSLLGCF